ncbi:glycosyltransferase [Pseudobutyrivibrio xylanivorans]|uniref:Glycosyltransferases, probably involved in cell wall biogenesis n=1 Tax=Pseudobutyrivibrio xylanivorans DSM 14809 TaxID=1123012 RepID=A0A1M6IGH0_PSEXY|nr:glycosyltransferase [Pseudobutyrivibrio xylanivorans]SHJ33534.1 Glycosyltransferases, probably involved in cell wall biogenesis [Pseudobutyrivibrio xylanivorans DSM 14809]
MKKIAIIAPCILPVPASKGGAVEELITCIVNQNEISKKYAIDLYTVADHSYELKKYSCTNIIQISPKGIISKLDRVCDKYYRSIKIKSAKRLLDKQIIAAFMEESSKMDGSYSAVIVENQMSLAIELLKRTGFSRDYPIYFHMHNDVDVYRTPKYISTLVSNGVQFIAVSQYIKTQILKYSEDAVVHLLYNGISLNEYSMTTRIDDGMIRFLYAGRIIPNKGVMEAVEAFIQMLIRVTPELKNRLIFEIIGFSDRLCSYEKKIFNKAEKYHENIICHKRLATTQMAEKYNEFDVVVMPTVDEEPFGLVALETIAKGMALITTNSGAIPEVVGDGAVIVDKNSDFIQKLSLEMEKLAVDSDYRNLLGKKAFSVARRVVEFDINSYYYRLVNILDTECSQNKISVIVPIYNAKNELERCINSLLNQTYRDLEIILINDGSTDGSDIICDNYKNVDSRVRVIHQENRGLSGARNAGLDASTGSYIFFVDSDDYLEADTLDKLMKHLIECKADVAACGFVQVFDTLPDEPFTNVKPGIWSGREAVMQMMSNNNLCTTAWNKLYKSELWKDIRFPEGRLHEDEATTYKVLYKSKIVTYMPDCFYKYYQRDNSIMKSGLEKRYGDYLLAIEERIQYFKKLNEQHLVDYSILVLLQYIKYVYRNVNGTTKGRARTQYNELLGKYGVPKSISLRKKIALIVFRIIKA